MDWCTKAAKHLHALLDDLDEKGDAWFRLELNEHGGAQAVASLEDDIEEAAKFRAFEKR